VILLTLNQIKSLSNRPKVNHEAVINFLFTISLNQTKPVALLNLGLDARLYFWNKETIKAIKDGINLHYA